MSKIDEITRENWIMSTFPEWGTWLNEEIENEEVKPGTVAMWWLGCTGMWFKTPGGCNITVDLWCGNGKRSHGDGKMKVGHQMANMMTTDENGKEIPVPFIGPKKSVELWEKWGVPADRCITVRPGDSIKIKDIEIIALDSFDRTCIVTTDSQGEDREELTGKCPTDMDDKAVNYLIKTPGGNIYHSGDSHYSIYFAKHGKDYDIDVAFGSYGENPVGMQDKMTSVDILRMAEALRCKVVVPIHYDVWTNFMADVNEINVLYHMKKDRLGYEFHPFFWEVGGKYVYPTDKEKRAYHHRRGFEDCFEAPQNIPFRSLL